MTDLEILEHRSVYIIREAYARFKNIALLWSIGKDSTTLAWLCRKAFFGKIPFPVVHIDTGFKFKEIYKFRDTYAKTWGFNLIISQNKEALDNGINPEKSKLDCCNALKTEALKKTIQEYDFKALLLAIRRDEHGIRAKERYFSPRDLNFAWDYKNQPAEFWELYSYRQSEQKNHFRIHPMLHWRELDIWRYIQKEKIPVTSLYFSSGKTRYRSIGCACCCAPINSTAGSIKKIVRELETTNTSERSGRAQDKEDAYAMQKLRSLGYM